MNDELIKIIATSLGAATPMQDEAPWKLTANTAVGGAIAAGFLRDTEDLLVVSHKGQGVYDCPSGLRTYRNRESSGYYPEILEATKLNDPNHARVSMAGLDGGGLRRWTADGWSIETIQIQWPSAYSLLQPPSASIYFLDPMWAQYKKDSRYHLVMKSEGLPVAFGFSWSGETLVWMDNSDLLIWSRHSG